MFNAISSLLNSKHGIYGDDYEDFDQYQIGKLHPYTSFLIAYSNKCVTIRYCITVYKSASSLKGVFIIL